jgi:thiol-disulfide isomerase/thioredoxin/uncharacterized membrane protein YphA (DoxX/SURF4 family)
MDTLVLGVRGVLACVFLIASLGKFANLADSRQAVVDFGLPPVFAPALAVLIPAAEIFIALCLLSAMLIWWGSIGATSLLVVFTAGISYNLARGRNPDCHCFGQLHSAPVGRSTVVRNVVLIGMSVWLVSRGPAGVGPGVLPWLISLPTLTLMILAGVGVVAVLMGTIGWGFIQLMHQNGRLMVRLETLENRMKNLDGMAAKRAQPAVPGASPLAGEMLGHPAPAFRLPNLSGSMTSLDDLLALGNPLALLFSDPTCGPCQHLLPEISNWQKKYTDLTFVLLSRGTAEANRAKLSHLELAHVLMQRDREISDAYHCVGTPAGIIVRRDGRIGSPLAMGPEAIRELVTNVAMEFVAARMRPPRARTGESCPTLELSDLDGRPFNLSQVSKETLVLFWDPSCGYCKRMLNALKDWEASRTDEMPELIVVSAGGAEQSQALGLRAPVLLDPTFLAGAAFGVSGTPSAILLDADAKVASAVVSGAMNVLALARKGTAVSFPS